VTALAVVATLAFAGCTGGAAPTLTVSGSAVGREADLIRRQLARFQEANPSLTVALRETPDAADQRHQLYVQWLAARSDDPDVLQLDVIWTPEFAAAGWIRNLTEFRPRLDRFFAAAVSANTWHGAPYALPWFVDVGMLYRRTDLAPDPPVDLDGLVRRADQARSGGHVSFGLLWQGARYEGLVTVFLEHLGAFGGEILDPEGRVAVDSDAAVRALTFMRNAIWDEGVVPTAVLTWQEEQTRFAFQNGQAAFMRNWPYAYALLQSGSESQVAQRVGVSPMPGTAGGNPTAALGGSALAVNAFSDQPAEAYRLIDYLLQPEQMIERAAVVGQLPPHPVLYDSAELARVLPVPASDALQIIESAVPRPVTPVYTQLSEILQVSLHRALTRQQEPRAALAEAASAIRDLLARANLAAAVQ
jgi:multiple sugar transport system substrate-binding protein